MTPENREDLKQRVRNDATAHGLSDDAKRVAAAWFGAGRVGATLHFGMVQSQPTAWAAAALAECVEKGVLGVALDGVGGRGKTYTSLVPCHPYAAWFALEHGLFSDPVSGRDDTLADRPLVEPVKPGSQVGGAEITLSGPPVAVEGVRKAVGEINRTVRKRKDGR